MIGTQALVEVEISRIKLNRVQSEMLAAALAQRIDEEVARIVRDTLEERRREAKSRAAEPQTVGEDLSGSTSPPEGPAVEPAG